MATVNWSHHCGEGDAANGTERVSISGEQADGLILGSDPDHGDFRCQYRLRWDASFTMRAAWLDITDDRGKRWKSLRSSGDGTWADSDRTPIAALHGCHDVDIWPTPFTNASTIRRMSLGIGERRHVDVVWISAFELVPQRQQQTYTRLAKRLYLFESVALDRTPFRAEIRVDDQGMITDYEGLFTRTPSRASDRPG